MATFNYKASQKTALRLIKKFGSVTSIGRTSGNYDPVDGTTTGDAITKQDATVVTIPASQSLTRGFDNKFIEELKKSKGRFFLVAAKGLTFDPESGDILLFENSVYDIMGSTPLNPAGTPVMHTLGARLSTKSITLFGLPEPPPVEGDCLNLITNEW